MARIRLGKRERQLRREQWAIYNGLKFSLIAGNLATLKDMPTSKGYRLTPNPKLGYAFNDPSNLPRYNAFGSDSNPIGPAKPLPRGTGSYKR